MMCGVLCVWVRRVRVQKRRGQGGRERGRERTRCSEGGRRERGREIGRYGTLHMDDMADS